MMPIFGIDRDLGRGAERDLVGRHVIRDVDDGQRTAAGCPRTDVHEPPRRLQLASRDRIQDEAHLALEHATGNRIESSLGLVTGLHALQGILLERRGKLLVPRVGIDEDHDRPESGGDDVHSRPQADLGDESGRWRPRHGLIEIPLGIGQLGAQATLDTYTRNLETARQSLTGAKAEEERARLAYSSNIDGVNTTVARLRSELADAQWDLDQTVTRAPAAGFVTQVGLRPGMYVVPAAFRSVMVFVNTDPRDQEFSAAFQQNSLQRVKAGDEAEAAFDAVPGRVFKGKVRYVLDAIAAGQLQPTGGLVDVGARTAGGRALAVIDITDDMSPYQIPLGAAAQVAIYTEHWHHVSLLRKILLRMRSWQNYIFLEGH